MFIFLEERYCMQSLINENTILYLMVAVSPISYCFYLLYRNISSTDSTKLCLVSIIWLGLQEWIGNKFFRTLKTLLHWLIDTIIAVKYHVSFILHTLCDFFSQIWGTYFGFGILKFYYDVQSLCYSICGPCLRNPFTRYS